MVHPLDSRPSAFWQVNAPAGVRRSSKRENILPSRSAAAAFLAFCLVAFGAMLGSRFQAGRNHVPGIILGTTLRVPMTVQRGDSLWSLAKRYGDPDSYILDRVDKLAQANQIPATASLMPGQRIIIPVSNPIEVSRLQKRFAKK
jgi:hypothetical protein